MDARQEGLLVFRVAAAAMLHLPRQGHGRPRIAGGQEPVDGLPVALGAGQQLAFGMHARPQFAKLLVVALSAKGRLIAELLLHVERDAVRKDLPFDVDMGMAVEAVDKLVRACAEQGCRLIVAVVQNFWMSANLERKSSVWWALVSRTAGSPPWQSTQLTPFWW